MRDLNTLTWPVARLGEALEAMVRQSGLAPRERETLVPPEDLAQDDAEARAAGYPGRTPRCGAPRWLLAVAAASRHTFRAPDASRPLTPTPPGTRWGACHAVRALAPLLVGGGARGAPGAP